ncbi:MAG TPA: metallophosphoesterase family protein, partial [Chthoniobacteraceae bacterium]|nr:metallophosphoesterase family protein [Chthoniobacteraceae bacterium]
MIIPRLLAIALFSLGGVAASAQNVTLIPTGSEWRYKDDGERGEGWRTAGFNDASWSIGRAELGYGKGGEVTTLNPGAAERPVTTYLRKTFVIPRTPGFNALFLRLRRDDGAIVYLNGTEVLRSNMPGGAIDGQTLALASVSGADEGAYHPVRIPAHLLVRGTNVIAVELHQATTNSPDARFDLELIGSRARRPVFVTRGPYLQNATSHSITVRWRTDVACPTELSMAVAPSRFRPRSRRVLTPTTEHEITLTNLQPNTRYRYAIGDGVNLLEGNSSQYTFQTLPVPGSTQPLRIWLLGDCGTGGDGTGRAEAVRDAYLQSPLFSPPDALLMLGDNAYDVGTDLEHQNAIFDTFRSILRTTPLWSTLGNHETYADRGATYFSVFTFPTRGEAGGQPSGTEHYYSFDVGQVHFVCLDSMQSSRAPGSPMLTWLEADLASTTQKWTVAFWHHPPYSRGSHNSDFEMELVQMRQNVLPILEANGVDLVFAGHSHSYERSFLLDGHYGDSSTFSMNVVKDGGDGRVSGSGAYV